MLPGKVYSDKYKRGRENETKDEANFAGVSVAGGWFSVGAGEYGRITQTSLQSGILGRLQYRL